MDTSLTAVDRLNILLPWLNNKLDVDTYRPGDRPEDAETYTDYTKVRQALTKFVASFDGSAGAGYLHVVADPRPDFLQPPTALTDDDLEALEAMLRLLVKQGFGDPTMTDLMFPVGSLRFAVRSTGRPKTTWTTTAFGNAVPVGGITALRNYRAPGAYVLRVSGPTGELVPFLVAHLLTQADMVNVHRCERPGCPRVFVRLPGAKGRPQRFCVRSCYELNRENQPQKKPKKKQKKQKTKKRGKR